MKTWTRNCGNALCIDDGENMPEQLGLIGGIEKAFDELFYFVKEDRLLFEKLVILIPEMYNALQSVKSSNGLHEVPEHYADDHDWVIQAQAAKKVLAVLEKLE